MLAGAFTSARLSYRAVEDTEAEKTWYHEHIRSDPVTFGLGDSNLVRPQTKTKSDDHLSGISKSLLGVVICLKPQSETVQPTPIGVLVLDDEASDNYRHHHRLACLSLSIATEHQNQGYGREAINWAVDWAFLRANIHSISLGCVEYNEKGRHLYEGLGFVLEGRFRKCHFHERRWWDLLLFSMLEEEWEALRASRDTPVNT
ncbi:acyl-CoA N-acyltransferase [Microdochium trichocladiopsis]|uniref:Acyl-CoA N-acyltransferase n=1 Tax=Microdochium trichocladiopsis TaxID=1682393 RepID=A0A9P9BMK8_9PEZI|nr:acyl-CoA N-acyltransferase [Microdochium trichocladiopsis]KAH7026380.1 acyl-CoA N-acyltransferase [Microdochium trichocladiopsis]